MTPSAVQLAIVEEAMRWIGTPYHHQGDVLGVGVDCAMLPVRVFTSLGLIPADFDPRPYPPDWMLHRDEERYLGHIEQFARKVDDPMPGDISLYRVGRCIAHGGIVINEQEMIHACIRARRVLRAEIEAGSSTHKGFWRLHSV